MTKIANRQIFIFFFDFLKKTWVRRIWATLYKIDTPDTPDYTRDRVMPIQFSSCGARKPEQIKVGIPYFHIGK